MAAKTTKQKLNEIIAKLNIEREKHLDNVVLMCDTHATLNAEQTAALQKIINSGHDLITSLERLVKSYEVDTNSKIRNLHYVTKSVDHLTLKPLGNPAHFWEKYERAMRNSYGDQIPEYALPVLKYLCRDIEYADSWFLEKVDPHFAEKAVNLKDLQNLFLTKFLNSYWQATQADRLQNIAMGKEIPMQFTSRYMSVAKAAGISLNAKQEHFQQMLYAKIPSSIQRVFAIEKEPQAYDNLNEMLEIIAKTPGIPTDVTKTEICCPYCVEQIKWECKCALSRDFSTKRELSKHCQSHPNSSNHTSTDCRDPLPEYAHLTSNKRVRKLDQNSSDDRLPVVIRPKNDKNLTFEELRRKGVCAFCKIEKYSVEHSQVCSDIIKNQGLRGL